MKSQPKLKNVLTLNFVLVGILPIVATGFITLEVLTRGLEHEITQRNNLLAHSMAGEIERFLHEPLFLLGHMADVLEQKAFFEKDVIQKYLMSVHTSYGFFDEIRLLDKRGVVVQAAPDDAAPIGLDISGDFVFQSSSLGSGKTPKVFASMKTGKPAIAVAEPYRDGTLLGYLNLGTLNTITDKSAIGPSGFASIVDQDGTYIAHPDHTFVNQGKGTLDPGIVRQVLGGDEGSYRYRTNGIEMIGSVALVPQTGWLVVVSQPAEEAFSQVGRIRKIFWGGSALAVFLALFVALGSLRKTLTPITDLASDVKRVAEGDYNIRPRPGSYKEIHDLADGFRLMAEGVRIRERALRESEEKHRLLVAHMNDLIVKLDTERRLWFVSPSYCELFGVTPEDIIGSDFLEHIHPDDIQRVEKSLEKIYQPPFTADYEARPHLKEGVRWFAWSARAILTPGGDVESIISVGRDVTERKIAEDKLRRSEQQFRDLFNSISDIVYTQDLDGRFLSVNPSLLRAFGYLEGEAQEIVGRRAADFMKPELRPLFLSEYLEGIKADGYYEGLSHYYTKDGTRIILEYRSVLVKPSDGDPYISGIGRDVTDKILAERQITQLQDQMLDAKKMEAVGTLAGGIAHDFNNLLMGIQGSISLMLLDVSQTHPHYDKLRVVEQYVKSGADLTRQLLGFARGGKYEVKPLDLNALVEQSADLFGRTRKEIRIEKGFQKGLWAVEADRSQMEQVLLNLYVNAWQSMPSGGVLSLSTTNIELSRKDVEPHQLEPGRYVQIKVKDTGVGMDPATRERVFEPFFTSREMGRGTGLGLASVYGIVKNHGGFIRVSSEKGKGSSFTICLPACEASVSSDTPAEIDLVEGSGVILLVDDEAMILEVGGSMIEKLGYEVVKAKDGEEAISFYSGNVERVDLAIVDMIMPGTGGGEVFDRIRRMNPRAKVLLSSGYSIEGNAQSILDRGCNGFIQKPFDLQSLSQKINEILNEDIQSRAS